MKLTVRSNSEKNELGFVEMFKLYRFGDVGSITVTVGVDNTGKFVKPYVLRGGEFIGLDEIDKEVGISAYIKAKKPIYSMLNDGFIATIKAYINFKEGSLVKEKSNFKLYVLRDFSAVTSVAYSVNMVQIMEVPDEINSLMDKLMEEINATGEDREAFLRSRLVEE